MRSIILTILIFATGCECQSQFTIKQGLHSKPTAEFTITSNSFKILK